jgi:hypothetical protein
MRGLIYRISVNRLRDCAGNVQEAQFKVQTGMPETAGAGEVIINELLFNPPFDGKDYVELYNRSNKIIDLGKLYLANRNSLGEIGSMVSCSNETWLLLPGAYAVLSENSHWIIRRYNPSRPDALLNIQTLPSFPDDKGVVVLLNEQGMVIDELNYTEKWHFPLLANTEGVALERISAGGATQEAGNWHSAAEPAYGSPAGSNSQAAATGMSEAEWQVTPRVISPDNDGMNDFASIQYRFPSPGFVANIRVFDAAGRPVRQLQRNALCGIEGTFRWDGLGDYNRQLQRGIYIVWAEVFSLEGQVRRYKKVVVVTRL